MEYTSNRNLQTHENNVLESLSNARQSLFDASYHYKELRGKQYLYNEYTRKLADTEKLINDINAYINDNLK